MIFLSANKINLKKPIENKSTVKLNLTHYKSIKGTALEENLKSIRNICYAWVQRKLGEVAEFNPRSVLPDSFKYVDLESVVGTSLISHRIEHKDTAPSRAQRLAKNGDVFYQTVRPYQQNNFLFDLPFSDYVFSTGYAQLRPNIDSCFLLCLLQEEKFVAKVLDNCTGTSYPAINSSTLADMEVTIPLKPTEQTAIGTFFRTLDDTITLHKRMLDGLKELKSGYLQVMFPQNGETVPRVRFKGFEGEWKSKRIGDFLSEYTEKSTQENQFNMLSSTTNGIEIRKGRVDGKSNKGYKVIRKGSVVLSPQNLWLGNINYNTDFEVGIVSPSYKTFYVVNSQEHFISTLIRLPVMFEKYKTSSEQGASVVRRNLDMNVFIDIDILIPNIEEQTAIGNFFCSLDEQITDQAEKLEQLNQLKTAYLQKMFI